MDDNVKVELGKSTQIAGEAAFTALEAAVDDLKAGKIDALLQRLSINLIFNPINSILKGIPIIYKIGLASQMQLCLWSAMLSGLVWFANMYH